MPLFAAVNPAIVIDAQSFLKEEMKGKAYAQYFDADVSRSTIKEISVGTTVYPFRRPLNATFLSGRSELLVDGFSPVFIGHGSTPHAAFLDWRDNVHRRFQELFPMRPFERQEHEEDVRDWDILTNHIDVAVYKNQMPIKVTQFGTITKARPMPSEITWDNGTKDPITLDKVFVADFVTFKAGQPVEAIVARDPVTFELLSIDYIKRRRTPSRLDKAEEEALLEKIGSQSQLEQVDWS